MSGMFGIYNRNGHPIDKKIANDMLKAMSDWKPDDSDLWIDGPVALGNTMLWNTPESKYEHLPLQKDTYILTMDARIDNRDELDKELVLPKRPIHEVGDSEFILAAYQKWGEECPKYLLGDFAFAIWDGKKEQLFCARDHIGIKSLYYYIDDERVIVSNEIKVILSHNKVSSLLNEDAVAHYLHYSLLSDLDMTFYQDIYKLNFASNMTIMKDKVLKDIYWKAEESPKIFYKSMNEYIDRARELLEDAVNVRVRSSYQVSSHISGGLDSSSIAVLASRKLKNMGNNLIGFNWIPVLNNSTDKDYYEWGNSKKIARLENIEHQAIDLTEDDILKLYKSTDITNGNTIAFWYEQLIQKYANRRDIRVILSGTGGDEFLSNSGYSCIAGFFWKGEFKNTYKSFNAKGLKSKHTFLGFLKHIYLYVLKPSIPDWLYCKYNKSYCEFNNLSNYITPYMKKLIKNLSANNRLLMNISVRNRMLNSLYDGLNQTRIESWNVAAIPNKIEYRYPLLDKRIIEFSLGIPEELFCQSENRYLFRKTIGGLLPEEIIWSDTKNEPKRVRHFLFLTQKAQAMWKQKPLTKNKKNKYFDIDTVYSDIDKYNLEEYSKLVDYDKVLAITNIILLINGVEKEC